MPRSHLVASARTPIGKLAGALGAAALCGGGGQGDAALVKVVTSP